MAKYTVNPAGVEQATRLIDAKQYVLDSDWGEVQPKAPTRTPTWSVTPGRTTPVGILG